MSVESIEAFLKQKKEKEEKVVEALNPESDNPKWTINTDVTFEELKKLGEYRELFSEGDSYFYFEDITHYAFWYRVEK